MPIRFTPAVKALAIAFFSIFILQQTADRYFGTDLLSWFGLIPTGFVVQHRLWQILTYAFLHGDVSHLFFNLVVLVFVGAEIEALWGTLRFLRFFFLSVMFSGACYVMAVLFVTKEGALSLPLVGASGGLYALLLAYAVLFSERTLLFMMVFPMKAKVFAGVLALMAFLTTFFSPSGALSGLAHLSGMVGGGILLWLEAQSRRLQKARQNPRRKPAISRGGSHLKVIQGGSGVKSEKDGDEPPTWH